jgi:predicted MPP superfamily phosphohydrolase
VNSVTDVPAFDLILVGHTHGGQLNLPLVSGAWLHQGASGEYVRGLYEVHGSPLYVNRGIGTTTLPVRIGSRPEITHFTFHAA